MRSILNIVLLIFILNCSACSDEVNEMVFLNADFNNMPCEVYFFESWSTYQHPVKPTGPLEYEKALSRKGFYRAWLYKKNNEDLFVFFEGVENKVETTKIEKPDNSGAEIRFYEYIKGNGIGREISASDSLKFDSFYVSLPNIQNYLVLITQKKGISYEYVYDEAGKLIKGVITDFDGNVKPLIL